MSKSSSDAAKKPTKQPGDDLSKAMGQLSVTTDDDKTSTQPKNLSDMPIDVVGLIIERSDYKRQLILRKTSKSFRALVDKQKPVCESIEVVCYDEFVWTIFNKHRVMYTTHDYEQHFQPETVVIKEDFEKIAFNDLASTLKNPRLQLEKCRVSFNFNDNNELEKYKNHIQPVLESLNHQVSAKEIKLYGPSCLLSILPYLKPGVLKRISLSFDRDEVDWRTIMNQVAFLEQWKQAKEFEMCYPLQTFPLEYATHFKRIRLNEGNFAGGKFIRIRDFLSKSNNFEQCTLTSIGFFSPNLVYELLGEPVSSNTMEKVFHYFIPDSDYYLEFKKATGSIEIEITKKKRESK